MSGNKHGAVGVRSTETGDEWTCAEADPGANYHTLCGTSLDDDMFERFEVDPKRRIECEKCRNVWRAAHMFKAKDFAS